MMEVVNKIVNLAINSGAAEAEVFIIKSEGFGFSIEKNSVSSLSGGVEKGIGIRIIKDKKIGFAYCTSEDKAEDSVKKALSLSRLGKELDYTFPEPKNTQKIENIYDDRIINFNSEEALKGTMKLIEAAHDVDSDIVVSRGGIGYSNETFAIANSKGLEVIDSGTEIAAGVGTVLKKKSMSTGFDDFSSRILDIDFSQIGKNAAELAKKGQDAKKIEGKEMTVLFTPHAVSNLFEYITAPALYGEAVHKGESIYSDKAGENVASENISIIDDGTLSGGLNSAMVDDEGVPSKRNVLMKNGVLEGFLYDQSNALEFEAESTGNAMRTDRLSTSRNYRSPPVVKGRNIVVEGKAKKIETMISEVDEGVLVHDIMGAHTSNPVSGDFSVNSSILFKIEKGEIVYPVISAMLGGNFHECLKHVNDIGDDYKLVSGSLTPVSFFIPTISFEGIRVTG
jgi:PmbA protein